MSHAVIRAARYAGLATVILLACYIAYVSVLRYIASAEPPPPPIAANAFADPFLTIHVIGGVVALILGPFQLIGAIRTRWPHVHRATGLAYVAACLIGAPAGLVLSFGTTAGPVAGAGFAVLGVLTLYFTGQGLRTALARRFDQHREWMLRSFALVGAAITLRLMLPASFLLGLDFGIAYPAIAWLCWTTNLALAEVYIRRKRTARSSFDTLAAA